jgi:hypothetical protein
MCSWFSKDIMGKQWEHYNGHGEKSWDPEILWGNKGHMGFNQHQHVKIQGFGILVMEYVGGSLCSARWNMCITSVTPGFFLVSECQNQEHN